MITEKMLITLFEKQQGEKYVKAKKGGVAKPHKRLQIPCFFCINFYLLSKKSAILNLYNNSKNYCRQNVVSLLYKINWNCFYYL